MPNNKCVGGETFNIIRNSNRQKLGGWACVWDLKGFHITFIYSFIRYVSCCRWNCSPSLWLRLICLSLVTILSSLFLLLQGRDDLTQRERVGGCLKKEKKSAVQRLFNLQWMGILMGNERKGERGRESTGVLPLCIVFYWTKAKNDTGICYCCDLFR